MEYRRNEYHVFSATGVSVCGHVENQSITEANVAPSRNIPDPRDPGWVPCSSRLSQAILSQKMTEKLTERVSAKVLQDVSHQMKHDTVTQVQPHKIEVIDLCINEGSPKKKSQKKNEQTEKICMDQQEEI